MDEAFEPMACFVILEDYITQCNTAQRPGGFKDSIAKSRAQPGMQARVIREQLMHTTISVEDFSRAIPQQHASERRLARRYSTRDAEDRHGLLHE